MLLFSVYVMISGCVPATTVNGAVAATTIKTMEKTPSVLLI